MSHYAQMTRERDRLAEKHDARKRARRDRQAKAQALVDDAIDREVEARCRGRRFVDRDTIAEVVRSEVRQHGIERLHDLEKIRKRAARKQKRKRAANEQRRKEAKQQAAREAIRDNLERLRREHRAARLLAIALRKQSKNTRAPVVDPAAHALYQVSWRLQRKARLDAWRQLKAELEIEVGTEQST